MTVIRYIENKEKRRFFVNGLRIFVKDDPPNNVNIRNVIKKLFIKIPNRLLSGLRSINIGLFEELENFEREAMYKN